MERVKALEIEKQELQSQLSASSATGKETHQPEPRPVATPVRKGIQEDAKQPKPSEPAVGVPALASAPAQREQMVLATSPSPEGSSEKLLADGLPERVNSTTHRNAWAKMASCLHLRSWFEVAVPMLLHVSPSENRAYESGKFEHMLAFQEGTLQAP